MCSNGKDIVPDSKLSLFSKKHKLLCKIYTLYKAEIHYIYYTSYGIICDFMALQQYNSKAKLGAYTLRICAALRVIFVVIDAP